MRTKTTVFDSDVIMILAFLVAFVTFFWIIFYFVHVDTLYKRCLESSTSADLCLELVK